MEDIGAILASQEKKVEQINGHYSKKISELNEQRHKETEFFEKHKQELLERFTPVVRYICDRDGYGDDDCTIQPPNYVYLQHFANNIFPGLGACWDADHPNDRSYKEFSWETLQAEEINYLKDKENGSYLPE